MRQDQEEMVQQSVHAATRIKQNLLRAAQPTLQKNIGATFERVQCSFALFDHPLIHPSLAIMAAETGFDIVARMSLSIPIDHLDKSP